VFLQVCDKANEVYHICAIRFTRGLRPTNTQQIAYMSGPAEHELCECGDLFGPVGYEYAETEDRRGLK
jgi:hypothetical protein